jgi:NADPH-dependent curcumin reductase CurA
MSKENNVNREIVLNSRPIGAPTADNFHLEKHKIPVPSNGQVLLRTIYLSLDPYMRGRMSDAPSYAAPVPVGGVMVGGTVSRVETSLHPDYQPGDLVLGYSGWQEYALSNGTELTKLDARMTHPSLALGILGMPGFTAYMGLLDIGRPKEGETIVVAAASGGVGSAVGQIAKLLNVCRVVGIAGGADKCRFVVEQLGFDACIDRRSADFPQQLVAACPDGIDVYFESVGGAVFDAVLPLLNVSARVSLCGLISHYNDTSLPQGPDRLGLLTRTLLTKRIKMQGFIIYDDYGDRYEEFYDQMRAWLAEGRITYREDIVDGLENAPKAFIGLLEGKNFGKLVVRVTRELIHPEHNVRSESAVGISAGNLANKGVHHERNEQNDRYDV